MSQDKDEADLMEALRLSENAEGRLEEAMLEILGWDYKATPSWKWGEDWWFDTYDASVELVGATAGAELTDDEQRRLRGIGIHAVYVSYADGKGYVWYTSGKHGQCSPREKHDEGRGTLVAKLMRGLEAARAEGEQRGFARGREEAARVVERIGQAHLAARIRGLSLEGISEEKP